MTAYLICHVKISDPEIYAQYAARTPGVIAQFGGRYIIRGGTEPLEGECFDGRFVVVEFPSVEAVKVFYHSKEYQDLREIRIPISEVEFMIAPGV